MRILVVNDAAQLAEALREGLAEAGYTVVATVPADLRLPECVAEPSRDLWWLMAMCVPIIPLGVWSGWHLHNRVDQKMLYRLCYGLLVLVAFKLLWDGVSGYIPPSG